MGLTRSICARFLRLSAARARTFAAGFVAILTLVAPVPVKAHPHVFITAKSDLVYDAGGSLTGVRQHWTFDESYSAFAVQGLDARKDGKYTREDLQALAKVNIESLAEYDYFSYGKSSGVKLEFGQPVDYWLEYAGERLTLNFTLPLRAPVSSRTLTYQVYDPTYFVAFSFENRDAVTLVGAKPGCTVTLKQPPRFDTGSTKTLSEDFFNQLSAGSDYGAGQADRALVACP